MPRQLLKGNEHLGLAWIYLKAPQGKFLRILVKLRLKEHVENHFINSWIGPVILWH